MHVVKLMALICAVIPFQSWSGDYTWTYLGTIGNDGDADYLLEGTISLSDIPDYKRGWLCAKHLSCYMHLSSDKCNGNGSSNNNSIPGVFGETPVTYLEKIGWRVSIKISTCSDGRKPMTLFLADYAPTGSQFPTSIILASSTGTGGGGVIPPVPKPEPDPLKCSLTLRRDTLDWGTVPLGELNVNKLVGGYLVTVSCSGGSGTATARLKITNMGGNSNIAEMKNDSGDVIPAKVILENENNTKTFTVRNGYDSVQDVFARIQSYNISTYGEYKGSALLTLEVL